MRAVILAVVISLLVLGGVSAQRTILVSEDPASLALAAGNHYAKAEEFESAKKWYSIALENDPSLEEAVYNQGYIEYKQGDLEKAQSFFEQAIALDQNYLKAHYSLGLLYHQRGEYAQAIAHLVEAATLDPRNAGIHFDLGVAYIDQFRAEEAQGSVSLEDLDLLREGLSQYTLAATLDPTLPYAASNAQIVENVLNEYASAE